MTADSVWWKTGIQYLETSASGMAHAQIQYTWSLMLCTYRLIDMKLSAVALLFLLGVCSRYEHEAQALSDACQIIHDPQVSLYSASKTPDKQHTSSSKIGKWQSHKLPSRVSPENFPKDPGREAAVYWKIKSSLQDQMSKSIVYLDEDECYLFELYVTFGLESRGVHSAHERIVWCFYFGESFFSDLLLASHIKIRHSSVPTSRCVVYFKWGYDSTYHSKCVEAYSETLYTCRLCIIELFQSWNPICFLYHLTGQIRSPRAENLPAVNFNASTILRAISAQLRKRIR